MGGKGLERSKEDDVIYEQPVTTFVVFIDKHLVNVVFLSENLDLQCPVSGRISFCW